jgi:GNAT superfamily N-acetyltransferase
MTMSVKQPPYSVASQWQSIGSRRLQPGARAMDLSHAIRPALLIEREALLPLFEELDEHHRLRRPDLFRKPQGARREPSVLDSLILGPDSAILVAEAAEGKLLGAAVLIVRSIPASAVREPRRFVELDQLIVQHRARRLGVGRSLMRASKAWANGRDVPNLEVSVWSFNAEATEFYRKVGFQPTIERFEMPSAEIGAEWSR